ncbi:hypothetical protein GCM10011319_12160 [Mameliella alba]|nr:hypothetical protein GCM10011319_12160 [Mameliella alba]
MTGWHLAEFNIGILRYDWEDPRIAEFSDNLDRVFAVAERSPGYVWHMAEAEMDAAQTDPGGPLGGNPGPRRPCRSGATCRASNISSGRPCTGGSTTGARNGSMLRGRGCGW